MYQPVISGTGVFTLEQIITNDEPVVAFSAYVDKYNVENAGGKCRRVHHHLRQTLR